MLQPLLSISRRMSSYFYQHWSISWRYAESNPQKSLQLSACLWTLVRRGDISTSHRKKLKYPLTQTLNITIKISIYCRVQMRIICKDCELCYSSSSKSMTSGFWFVGARGPTDWVCSRSASLPTHPIPAEEVDAVGWNAYGWIVDGRERTGVIGKKSSRNKEVKSSSSANITETGGVRIMNFIRESTFWNGAKSLKRWERRTGQTSCIAKTLSNSWCTAK